MGKNYYATLGLSMGSSDIEIKRAYKQLALKYHPDKNKAKDAAEKFKEVSEAYVFLSDKNKNEKADFKYRGENSKNEETKENFEYDTEVLFESLYVKLEDILTGCTKKMNIIRKVYRRDGTRKKEIKQLIVKVKPGSKAGTKIKFPREGNQLGPNNSYADIVITIRDKPHPLFKREGSNLRWTPKSIKTYSMPGYDRVLQVPTLTDWSNSLRSSLSMAA
ncbi:hypothetical protein WDU94_010793 [Cyamophila willieti]